MIVVLSSCWYSLLDFLSALTTVAVADECANSAALFSSAAYWLLAAVHAASAGLVVV
jgi:hypothetical protein